MASALASFLRRGGQVQTLCKRGMGRVMLSVTECAEYVGLNPNELLLGPGPTAKHKNMLDCYLLNRWRGEAFVAQMISDDLRAAVDLGASSRAADLLLVLRLFLTDCPTTTCAALVSATGPAPAKAVVVRRRPPNLICLSFDSGRQPAQMCC